MKLWVTMMLEYQLIFIIIGKLFASGEWIEMPQFSDESKVYKLSVQGQNFLQKKLLKYGQKTIPDYDFKRVAQLLNDFETVNGNTSREITFQKSESTISLSESDNFALVNLSEELPVGHTNSVDDPVNISASNPKESLELVKVINSGIESSTTESPSTLESPTDVFTSISTTAQPIVPATPIRQIFFDKKQYINETKDDLAFQDYLPMGMLRKVHQNLNSQPDNINGKMRFLKKFETELIVDIEARLSTALAPIRQKRGAHDHWDHDDEIGFPSLEGALMAISFLTFAVYLIRLVMLLFRNANNTTAGQATILFGRKRRSDSEMDTLADKTEEILKYLNSFKNN
ncbi:uncharacterized protein LOC105687893 [Athalia rosae]|uniref:uncharacterized protein LOC105687893 n=1 Tax=Athalia rosae TaxID=37344 RepID=UPI002033F077|nr:uncharacterized protein LOC105687893 [Athalia rosae]